MCGLIGQALKATNGAFAMDADAFEAMLYIDALRGDDSTGIAAFYTDGEMDILKEASTADNFRRTHQYKQFRTRYLFNGKAVIGHNRKKTSGSIKDSTAHPFLIADRYAFTHNGTLTNHQELKKLLPEMLHMGVAEYDEPKEDVDSEVLGTMICPFGEDIEKLGKQLSKVEGAYACVWLDQVKEKLYMIRNKERPLYIALTNAGYFYASEPSFIYAACNRNRISVTELTEVPVDTLLSINLDGSEMVLKKQEVAVVKKAQPTTKHTRKSGGQNTGSTTETDNDNPALKGGASKQAMKRFRQAYLHGTVWFEVDDYHVIGNKRLAVDEVGDYLLVGSNEAIEPHHQVFTILRKATEEEIIENYVGQFLQGTVADVTWNVKETRIDISATHVKLALNETTTETQETPETKGKARRRSTKTQAALH